MTTNDQPPAGNGSGEGPSQDPGFLARYKEFALTSLAVDQRTAMLVLFVIISIMGIQSYRATPKESFPEMTQPILAINTVYPGVSPADIESQVTRVLEEDLSTIPELDELTSTSVEGYSSITAQFQTSVNLDEALQKVREKVDLAKPDLPADAEEPSIVEFNFSEVPIMQVNVSGEYGLVRLKELAEEMQDRFEMIPSVLRADLRGGLEREVKVDVDLGRLQYYGVELQDVIDAIRDENVNIPGGSIDVGDTKYLVRVDGELDDPSVIEDFVVTVADGRPIYVRDVATVDFGFAERESYSRMDDHAVVTLDIVKRSGENIIETAEAVKAEIEAMRPTFPPTTNVSITADQSKQIVMMVSALENNIVSGLILIIGVLLFFLGLRTSIFVAISIPTSMLLSFIVLYYMGVTLNMIVLFSLILALGMLVDNAIVVVENIYRFLEQGWERKLAVKKATGEVAVPIISSTATTLAAFLPLLFWPGEVGEFMGYLPITLIVTLTASLFVALTIVPTLCSMYIQLEGTKPEPLRPAMKWTLIGATVLGLALIARSNLLTAGMLVATGVGLWALHRWVLDAVAYRFRTDGVTRIIGSYEKTVRWALDHRGATVGMTVVAFVAIATVFGITHSDQIEYFPESMPPAQLLVDVETPVGTRASVTDSIVQRIEQELAGVGGKEDWESVVSVTGGAGGGAGAAMMGGGGPSGPETGRVTVSLIDFQDRQRDGFETLAEMQASIGHDIAGAEITVGQASQGPPAGAPVSIEIVGEDPDVLKTLSDQLIEIVENAPVATMLVGLESDLNNARPELSVAVDREKAALYNLNTLEVGNAIRGAINGVEAAKYRTGNDEYDIIVRLAEPYRQELEGLRELTVMTEGTQVPLVSVASWSIEEGAGSIRRKDQARVATITSDVAAGYANNQALAEVQATLADFAAALPPGYTIQYTGQSQEQAEAQEFLSGAFMIALMLIALILISQFNSVVKPIVILTSVLMSTMGVLVGLMVFQMPFGIINTGIGIISLAGVVVNNAIILIDYIGTLRGRDGMDRREALVLAGKTRFRPVILTAITTALGLVTLAIGLNFDFFGLYRELNPDVYWGGEQAAWWGPMCVAIIAGILLATFLTLVLVPVMYSLVDDGEAFLKRYFVRDEAEEALPAGGSGGLGDMPVTARSGI